MAAIGLVALGGCKAGPRKVPPPSAAPVRFEPARQGLPTGKIWKSQIALGDIDGDGNADLAAISRLADGPWVFRTDGKGNWFDASNGLPRQTFCGGGVDFGDLNRDGKMDLAIADHCNGVYAFIGDGKGNWRNASSGLPTAGSEDVAIGDFDNDACPDLAIVTAQEEGIRAYKGDCKGTWEETSDGLPLEEWGNGVVMADMNADGKLDIAAAYSAGPRVFLGDGAGHWREASGGLPAPDIHGLYWGIDVGDVNHDGKLDIVTGAAIPGVEVFVQQPDGTYRSSSQGILPMNALGVAFGDMDHDGNLDVVAAGKTALNEIGGVYGVFVFKGDGKGNWTYLENSGLPATGKERTWGVAVGDVNGDGFLDVAVAFGDVISPTWRSGAQKKSANPGEKIRGPERGKYGSLEVWTSKPFSR